MWQEVERALNTGVADPQAAAYDQEVCLKCAELWPEAIPVADQFRFTLCKVKRCALCEQDDHLALHGQIDRFLVRRNVRSD